mmetsp:Transcript_10416/g.9195  ORF Transcript_10416/g.9195 Transcript_10416/m.9195 type:complete len:110 (+) Transcript_10416:583-912(+)
MNGIGTFTWAENNGNKLFKYEGEYSKGKKHGIGILTWKDGRIYRGQWYKGTQEGYGIFIFEEKEEYGQWELGKKIQNFSKQEAIGTLSEDFNRIREFQINDIHVEEKDI